MVRIAERVLAGGALGHVLVGKLELDGPVASEEILETGHKNEPDRELDHLAIPLAALALDAGYGRDDSGSKERLRAVLAVYAGHDDLERSLDQLAIEIEGFDDAQRHVAVQDSFVPEQKAIDLLGAARRAFGSASLLLNRAALTRQQRLIHSVGYRPEAAIDLVGGDAFLAVSQSPSWRPTAGTQSSGPSKS